MATDLASANAWLDISECQVADLAAIVETKTDLREFPLADEVTSNVLVYGAAVRQAVESSTHRRVLQSELVRAFLDGPGVVIFSQAMDPDLVDSASAVFTRLLREQAEAGTAGSDHFARPGANGRLWGALDKLAVADPRVFAAYYANDVIALASEAWVGPNYQVTSQLNVVYPGGQAQVPHRDYHLGFMNATQAQAYPRQAHRLSPMLTLQGAIAHVDMPVESGPTLLLPHSQKYQAGYVACHLPEFTEYITPRLIQVPLRKGDAVFFNPALIHGAGTNRTSDVARMANLLQVSSAFGRPIETVDTTAVTLLVYPVLLEWTRAEVAPERIANVVAAAASGYPFPTNLDRDAPIGAMAPQSQAAVVHQALAEKWDIARLRSVLTDQEARRCSPISH